MGLCGRGSGTHKRGTLDAPVDRGGGAGRCCRRVAPCLWHPTRTVLTLTVVCVWLLVVVVAYRTEVAFWFVLWVRGVAAATDSGAAWATVANLTGTGNETGGAADDGEPLVTMSGRGVVMIAAFSFVGGAVAVAALWSAPCHAWTSHGAFTYGEYTPSDASTDSGDVHVAYASKVALQDGYYTVNPQDADTSSETADDHAGVPPGSVEMASLRPCTPPVVDLEH